MLVPAYFFRLSGRRGGTKNTGHGRQGGEGAPRHLLAGRGDRAVQGLHRRAKAHDGSAQEVWLYVCMKYGCMKYYRMFMCTAYFQYVHVLVTCTSLLHRANRVMDSSGARRRHLWETDCMYLTTLNVREATPTNWRSVFSPTICSPVHPRNYVENCNIKALIKAPGGVCVPLLPHPHTSPCGPDDVGQRATPP